MASRAGTGERYATQVGALWSGLAHTLTPARGDRRRAGAARRREAGRGCCGGSSTVCTRRASTPSGCRRPPARSRCTRSSPAHSPAPATRPARVVEAVDEWGGEGAGAVRAGSGAARCSACASPGCVSPARRRSARGTSQLTSRSLKAPLAAAGARRSPARRLFVAGAMAELWPVWVAGMLAVCSSALTFRR